MPVYNPKTALYRFLIIQLTFEITLDVSADGVDMSHRILVTGASGYLGGTLLARWTNANLPPYERLYALVRTDSQAAAVKQFAAEPLKINVKDETSVREAVVSKNITVVFFLIDAAKAESQIYFIKALAEVQKTTGLDVHFLHVGTLGCLSNSRHVKGDKSDHLQRLVEPKYFLAMQVLQLTGPFWTLKRTSSKFKNLRFRVFLPSSRLVFKLVPWFHLPC